MKRFYLLLLFVLLSMRVGAVAGEKSALPFWGINLSSFHASTPRAISIPGAHGQLDYYWYWTFKFKYNTNLHELRKHYTRMLEKLEQSGADEEIQVVKDNIRRIDATLKKVTSTKLHVSLRTDTGEKIADGGNLVVRNLVERKLGRKLYTAREISHLDLNKVKESYDPDYGKGRWVEGIAVFSGVPSTAREFQLDISGLGKRILPQFLPGNLLYPAKSLEMENSMRPTMARVVKYFYRKIGQGAEIGLTPVKFEGRKIEWVWIWSMQIGVGRFREITIKRASGLTRKYVYAPYYIWNNTHKDQEISVLKAGFSEQVKWGGERFGVNILDDGGIDARWKLQVVDEVKKRIASGAEKKFAQKHEAYPVVYTSVDMPKYYKDKLGIEYIPSDPQVQKDKAALKRTLKSSDRIMKMRRELQGRKNKDVERKSKFMPVEGQGRLFTGIIQSGKIVRGLMVVRWGVDDINSIVAEIISSLKAKSLTGYPAKRGTLLAKYNKLRSKSKTPKMAWTRPQEPDDEAVVMMLVETAQKDIKKMKLKVEPDDIRRYGKLAPVAVLLNRLAWDELAARADKKQITDAFFEVAVNGVTESSTILSRFQSFMPKERERIPTPPDEFREEGTQSGISKGSVEDKKAKSSDEDVW